MKVPYKKDNLHSTVDWEKFFALQTSNFTREVIQKDVKTRWKKKMINVNDIKNGMTIMIDGQIYQVVEFLHVKPGKGSAFMKTKLRNMRTGGIVEKTFNTNVKFEKANINKQNVQYLYNTGDTYFFMNMDNYEQLELSSDQVGDNKNYLIENMNVYVILYEGELLGIDLPDKVEFTVVETEPAVRGNTTNNALKDATVETGLVVKVPMFIDQGEKILVTTADGKYSSRA